MATSSRKNRNSGTKTVLLLAGIAITLFLMFYLIIQSNQPPERTTNERVEAFRLAEQPMMGKEDAPVTLVEFADFKCPACGNFAATAMPLIKKELIDTGIAKMYFINFPFLGPDSTRAAMAVESVYVNQPDKFWAYYETIFMNQGDESTEWATVDRLTQLATDVGIRAENVEKLKSDLNNNAYKKQVDSDIAVATEMRVKSTPTIFIDDEMYPNTKGWDKIVDTVKQKVSTNAK